MPLFVIDHMAPQQPSVPLAPPEPWADLPKVVDLAKRKNAVIKISGACTLAKQPYPFPDIWDPLARLFGAWGLVEDAVPVFMDVVHHHVDPGILLHYKRKGDPEPRPSDPTDDGVVDRQVRNGAVDPPPGWPHRDSQGRLRTPREPYP